MLSYDTEKEMSNISEHDKSDKFDSCEPPSNLTQIRFDFLLFESHQCIQTGA